MIRKPSALPAEFKPFMKRLFCRMGPILLMALVLAGTGGCTKQARIKRLLRTANHDFAAEKYDDAEIEYKNVLGFGTMNPTAIGQLGRIYAKEGRLMEAHTFLVKATQLSPSVLPFELALSQVDVAFHQYSNAAPIALAILKAQPTNEEALLILADSTAPRTLPQTLQSLPNIDSNPAYHVVLGMTALREHKLEEAGNELKLAVAADPKSSEAYFAIAEMDAFEKKGKEAGEALKMAADLAPMRSPVRSKYIDFLIQSGHIEDGRKALQEMVDKAPDYIPGWVAMMNLALAEKKYDDAAHDAGVILGRDNRNYEGMLGLGTVSLARGDAAKAITEFENMNSLYQKSPQVKYQLAAAYLTSHDKVKGVANLNQALALDPSYAPAALLLAQLDIRGGDPSAAVGLLTAFLKKNPSVAQAHMLLADAYLEQQRPDYALSVYRNLAAALPKNPQIPLRMGIVLAEQHSDSEARAAFEKCLELDPDFVPAVEQLVNLDLAEKKYKDATAVAQQQIDKNPKAAEPWELLARVDMAQNNPARAAADLTKAIELDPDLPSPYLLLAQVYVHSKEYDQALQKLNSLVGRTNDASAYLQIGAIHEELKQFDAARDAYEKVLTINPNSPPALNNLAYIYAVYLDNLDRAYELAQKARELMPYNPNVGDTLGWVLYKKGDYSRSLSILEDSAEKSPGDAEIQFHLGMAHYMMDEEAPARVALQHAVASSQDFPNKDEARSRLALLNMNTSKADASTLAGLQKDLDSHPKDPVILNRIAAVEEQQGDFDKAADTYETTLAQNPSAIPIMAKLARVYAYHLNEPEKALKLATDAHKLAPDNAEVSAILGHLVYRTGDYVWALSLLESAADQIPNQPDLLYDLAWAYYSVGRVADAETVMQNALQTGVKFAGSEDAKHFVALADAFNDPSKVGAETGLAQKILQSDPKYAPALMVSASAAADSGNFKAAQDDYSQILSLLPMFAPAERQLAILDAGHFTDDPNGYAVAEKARTAYPDDLAVGKSLGILSYYQQNYSRSEEILQESITDGKPDGELYYYLGMDSYQLKQGKESKQDLQQALAMRIPDNLAAEAKRTLAELK
jgi:tetratricopeptide (TPR) repeat protein